MKQLSLKEITHLKKAVIREPEELTCIMWIRMIQETKHRWHGGKLYLGRWKVVIEEGYLQNRVQHDIKEKHIVKEYSGKNRL
jgi:hypothetical protein